MTEAMRSPRVPTSSTSPPDPALSLPAPTVGEAQRPSQVVFIFNFFDELRRLAPLQ